MMSNYLRHWLTRPLHPVFTIAALAAGVLCGVWFSSVAPSSWFTAWSWWFIWLFWLVLVFWKHCRWCLFIVIAVGCLIGYGRGANELASWVNLTEFQGKPVTLRGIVREDPEQGSGSEIRLRLDSITIDDMRYGGVYWVTVAGGSTEKIQRSDAVTIEGTLTEGFGTFAASLYRGRVQQLDKRARFDPMIDVRDTFAESIRSVMPDPQAALGIGYILGQKRALPSDFEEALLTVGLTHVVVASGYNLTILVRISRRLFVRVSRYTSVMVSGGLVLAFVGVTGMSPSMSRAGLVAGLSLVAWYYGRTVHPLVLLLVTAAISVVVQPSYAWGDVGWMLSFTAFAGVMFLAPLLQAYFYGDAKPGILRQIIGETFSAQLLTLPIIVLTFGVVSNVALLANLLVLPLVPLAMLLTFIAGLAAMLAPWVAGFLALPAYWLLTYMTSVIEWLAALPWASMELQLSVIDAVAIYGAILLIIIFLRRSTGMSFRQVNLVE